MTTEVVEQASDEEVERRQAEVREKATRIWDAALPTADGHPYAVLWGVSVVGLKVYRGALVIDGVRMDGALLAPMFDCRRRLSNLAFIVALSTIHFLPQAEVKNTYYGWGNDRRVIVVCRGFSIAAKIHATTKHAVAVSFIAENIPNVVEIMQKRHPEARVVPAADFLFASQRGADQVKSDAPEAGTEPPTGDTADAPPNGSLTVADFEHHRGQAQPSAIAPSEALAGSASDRAAELDRDLLASHPVAARLLHWIQKKQLAEFTRSKLLQFGPASLRNAEAARTALLTLVEHGWLTTEDGTRFRVLAAAVPPTKDLPTSSQT